MGKVAMSAGVLGVSALAALIWRKYSQSRQEGGEQTGEMEAITEHPGLDAIPVVDLSTDEAACVDKLRQACEEQGFLYLVGHGISEDLIEKTFKASKDFFDLPLEKKEEVTADENNRGWTRFGEETLDPSAQTTGDTKEGYYIAREVGTDSPLSSLPLHGPNVWPQEEWVGSNWRATMEAYRDACEDMGMRILPVLAQALGQDRSFFDPHFKHPMTFLRLLHYSDDVSKPDAGVYGAGAHTDYGLLTFLRTDDVPGLQIQLKSGEWIDVPPKRGAFIVNLGDLLEEWSNGRFRSTPHRVVNSCGRERYSIPFFFEPDFVAEVLPIGKDPKTYNVVQAGRHLLNKYEQTHADFATPDPPQG